MKDVFLTLRGSKNRGKTHLFLGDPHSNGLDKTVVEPGCEFSPGLWTVGVYCAFFAEGRIICPRTEDLPLAFDEDMPIVRSSFSAGSAEVTCRLAHIGGPGWNGTDYFSADYEGVLDEAALIVTDVGPAGAKIKGMTAGVSQLSVADGPEFIFDTPVDIHIFAADDEYDSPFAVVRFKNKLNMRVQHRYGDRAFPCQFPSVMESSVEAGFQKASAIWAQSVPAKINVPDERINRMWQQASFHILSAMEDGLPRISVNNYPIFWIRDCVIVVYALDVIGRSDLASSACEYLAPLVFSGGFGCESDNPGEGIWCLYNHVNITKDREWAKKIFPYIEERVSWIIKMLETDEPVFRPGDMRSVWAHWWPGSDLVCLPHEGNHIHGRMDGHSPDLYINAWAWAGLESASKIAGFASYPELASSWHTRAENLKKAITEELLPTFGNERDSCVSPWPTGIFENEPELVRNFFNAWYDENRLLDGKSVRNPEPLWTYFEVAQMHNAILLSERDKAWVNLDGFLDDPKWCDMSLFTESSWGQTEMLPFGTGRYGRGWLQQGAVGGNMPHNWTSAEVIALIKDMLVHETDDGLILFSGVPSSWLQPGNRIEVQHLPTRFGEVSFSAKVADDGTVSFSYQGVNMPPCRMDLPNGLSSEKIH